MTQTTPPDAPTVAPARQGRIGGALAMAILLAWVLAHIYGVFFFDWGRNAWVFAPMLMAVISWLYVGVFIIAHDCMHGSLIPLRPDWNRRIGRLCLALYAGFDFDALRASHRLHHRHSGTQDDPDFDHRPPHGFVRWYASFITEYFSWRQMLFMTAVFVVYHFVLGARYPNLIAFWAVPAILSSLQLFVFGTYLPHRPGPEPFSDDHRSRSSRFGWWLSLLSCFHFGYHHEHHLHPAVPWWRLPRIRKRNA